MSSFLLNVLVGLAVIVGLLCLAPVVVVVCFVPGILFIGGPVLYFLTSPDTFNTKEMEETYRSEGLRLRGRVLKGWTHGGEKTGPRHFVRALYRTPGDETYVKDLQVPAALQSDDYVDLLVLPQYPRSARIEHASTRHADGESSVGEQAPPADGRWLGVGFSFVWVCVWNVGVSHSLVDRALGDEARFLAKCLVAGEVVLAWIAGYFCVRAKRNADFRETLFGADQCDSSGEPQPDQPEKPDIAYQEMFPSSSQSILGIVRTIVTDYANCLGWILLGLYLLLFGGGHCLVTPFFINCKIKRLLLEEYLPRGEEVEGTVVHRSAPLGTLGMPLGVEVEYVVSDETLSSGQRYRKTLPVPQYNDRKCPHSCFATSESKSKPVPDTPRLLLLPNLPASARLADEIELCEKIYQTDWAVAIKAAYLFGAQIFATACVGDGLLFPNLPTWGRALVFMALQLCFGCTVALLKQHFLVRRILYGAKHIAETESTESENNSIIEGAVPWSDEKGADSLTDASSMESTQSESFSNEPRLMIV